MAWFSTPGTPKLVGRLPVAITSFENSSSRPCSVRRRSVSINRAHPIPQPGHAVASQKGVIARSHFPGAQFA